MPREITLFECSRHLGAFRCPLCGLPHNVALSLVNGDCLRGFCPEYRQYVEMHIVKRISGDEVPPAIKATAILP
jgi:hypothetical protein